MKVIAAVRAVRLDGDRARRTLLSPQRCVNEKALGPTGSILARKLIRVALALLLLIQLVACDFPFGRDPGAATPVPPASPTPVVEPMPAYSHPPEMGIPNKVLVGASYGANTDPAEFEQKIGGTLQIRRTYWDGDKVDSAVRTASEDVAVGRIPWISFELPYNWAEMAAGKGDDWTIDLILKLAALKAPVWIAFHHEPEGDGEVRDWVAMQRQLAPIVHAHSDNVAFSTILTGWNQLYGEAQYSLDALYPGDGLVDIMGFDPYNEYGVVKDGVVITYPFDFGLPTLAAFAKSKKAAWGLAETGYTDDAAMADPLWLDRTYSELSAHGAIALTYFNTELNAYGSWLIDSPAKIKAFSNILKRAKEK
ncbi:glycoside hydrolase family 26 protein [Arthrobacter sp. R4-81]